MVVPRWTTANMQWKKSEVTEPEADPIFVYVGVAGGGKLSPLGELQEENQQQKHGEWLVNFQLLKCTGSRKDVCWKYMPSFTSSSDKAFFFLLWAGFQLSSCSPWRLSILSSRKNQRGATGVGAKRTWLETCHQALSELKTCERTPAVVRFMSSYVIYLPVAFCWEHWLKAAVVAAKSFEPSFPGRNMILELLSPSLSAQTSEGFMT